MKLIRFIVGGCVKWKKYHKLTACISGLKEPDLFQWDSSGHFLQYWETLSTVIYYSIFLRIIWPPSGERQWIEHTDHLQFQSSSVKFLAIHSVLFSIEFTVSGPSGFRSHKRKRETPSALSLMLRITLETKLCSFPVAFSWNNCQTDWKFCLAHSTSQLNKHVARDQNAVAELIFVLLYWFTIFSILLAPIGVTFIYCLPLCHELNGYLWMEAEGWIERGDIGSP